MAIITSQNKCLLCHCVISIQEFAAVSVGKERNSFHYRLGWVGQNERMCERVFGIGIMEVESWLKTIVLPQYFL